MRDHLGSVKQFNKILATFTKNKSFHIMAMEALSFYNNQIYKYNQHFIDRDKTPFPKLTQEIILNHLNNCNTCNSHTLYSIFNFSAKQANYYKNKIIQISPSNELDNDVEMRDNNTIEEENEENEENVENVENTENIENEDYLERCTRLFERYADMILKFDRAISQGNKKK
jgi:hypothetical protein